MNESNPLLGWKASEWNTAKNMSNNSKPIREFLIIFNSDLVKNLPHGGMAVIQLMNIIHRYGYVTLSDYTFEYSHSNNISFSTAFRTVFRMKFYRDKEVTIDQLMMLIALQLEVNVVDVTEFL